MLNLAAYTGRDLQNCKSLLAQFATAGVADLAAAIARIDKELKGRLRNAAEAGQPARRPARPAATPAPCPKCGAVRSTVNGHKVPAYTEKRVEGALIRGCHECRWSAITNEAK